ISCSGSSDGQINIDVNGGVGHSLDFIWSNGINTEDQFGLQAGTYSVTILDSNGCVLNQSFILNEPSPLISSGIISSDFSGYAVSCYGSSDGAIDISVSGGVGAYNFSWSNGLTIEDASFLSAGTYSLITSDLNACADTLHFVLNSPDSINLQASIQNVLCNGFSNGSIDLNVSGGVAPFQFIWGNGSSANHLQSLSQGLYNVTISDQNNCMRTGVYQINEMNPLSVNISSENVKCYGGNDGSISVEVTGGSPDYIYMWSTGSTDQNQQSLSCGNYILSITDVNGCNFSDTILISQPDSISLSTNAVIYSNGYNLSLPNAVDGNINTIISGGSTPYSFLWSNGSSNQNLINLSQGLYTLQITDHNGCVKTSTAKIDSPNQLELPTGISPNGDGKNDQFFVRGLESYPNNTLLIFNRWGNLVFDKSNYMNDWQGTTNNGDYLPDGTYFVILEIHSPNIQLNGYVDIRK
ncbi:MAG: gliding motility-associated C-terminal domain-containing protein, partial [Bacteroidota bacterium]